MIQSRRSGGQSARSGGGPITGAGMRSDAVTSSTFTSSVTGGRYVLAAGTGTGSGRGAGAGMGRGGAGASVPLLSEGVGAVPGFAGAGFAEATGAGAGAATGFALCCGAGVFAGGTGGSRPF